MRSVVSEPNQARLVDSRQSSGSFHFPALVLKQGTFAPPALPGFVTTTPPSAIRVGRLHLSRDRRCQSCRPGTRVDFPCCTCDHCSACCHHYPGGTVGCGSRSLLQRRRPSSLLWRVGFHNDLSRPAQCSLTLRPAEFADLLRGRFKKCFSPFVTSWTAPCASGWSES